MKNPWRSRQAAVAALCRALAKSSGKHCKAGRDAGFAESGCSKVRFAEKDFIFLREAKFEQPICTVRLSLS